MSFQSIWTWHKSSSCGALRSLWPSRPEHNPDALLILNPSLSLGQDSPASCTHRVAELPMQGDPHADDLARKRAVFMARKAGPPPGIASSAWTTYMDLFELLNEFAVFLIEVRCDCTLRAQ